MNSRAPTEGAALGYAIRPERPEDAEAIAARIKAAFAPMSFSVGPQTYRDIPAMYVQYLAFTDKTPTGEATFVKGLEPD